MNTNTDGLGDLRRWAVDSKEQMRPLPFSLYSSPEVLDLEIERLFDGEWVCAGHVSELSKPGDFLTFDIVDKPVLVVCDDTGTIRSFLNVCVHRGSLLAEGSGHRK